MGMLASGAIFGVVGIKLRQSNFFRRYSNVLFRKSSHYAILLDGGLAAILAGPRRWGASAGVG